MAGSTEVELKGSIGRLVVQGWPNPDARYVALIAHGYGEHIGRYGRVADRLVAEGAVVYGPDHLGHGLSEGERALVANGEDLGSDMHLVADLARAEHPGLPVVMVGHSMGGLIATRFAQRFPGELAGLVLSGPVIGGNPALESLLALDPIPEVPIDPDVLSRDPEVGAAYAADPLVHHGPFKRLTLESLITGVEAVAGGPGFGALPVLWVHGEEDVLAPLVLTAEAFEEIRGERSRAKVYPGARHEVFNETNREEVLDDVAAFLASTLSGVPESGGSSSA